MFRSIFSALLIALAAQAPPADPPQSPWRETLAAAVRRTPRREPADPGGPGSRRGGPAPRQPGGGASPTPRSSSGLEDAPVVHPSLTRDDFTMARVTGRQRLPARGKRAAERTAARTATSRAPWRCGSARRWRPRADVADAFFQLAAIDRGLALLGRGPATLEDAAAAATELYRVGKGGQGDVLQASLETTSLDEQLSTQRAERRAQAARFNTLQGLPAAAPVPLLGPVDPGEGAPAAASLARRAAERSPAVASAAAQVRRAEQELELARLESRPDWTLIGYYGHRERFEDLAGVSVAINLPWAHRRRLAERQAEKVAELAAARAGVEAVRNQLRGRSRWRTLTSRRTGAGPALPRLDPPPGRDQLPRSARGVRRRQDRFHDPGAGRQQPHVLPAGSGGARFGDRPRPGGVAAGLRPAADRGDSRRRRLRWRKIGGSSSPSWSSPAACSRDAARRWRRKADRRPRHPIPAGGESFTGSIQCSRGRISIIPASRRSWTWSWSRSTRTRRRRKVLRIEPARLSSRSPPGGQRRRSHDNGGEAVYFSIAWCAPREC